MGDVPDSANVHRRLSRDDFRVQRSDLRGVEIFKGLSAEMLLRIACFLLLLDNVFSGEVDDLELGESRRACCRSCIDLGLCHY